MRPSSPADWRASAACADAPELFFSEDAQDEAKAKAACGTCPVRAECLAFALRNGIEFGVWGGAAEDERRTIIGPPRRPPRTDPMFCPGGRHLRAETKTTADGRCYECRLETWRRQSPPSGVGSGNAARRAARRLAA
jgi:WhiB family transcriptional regulator, redox-sensing transcriptional regulator